MLPFDRYPSQGRKHLGRPAPGTSSIRSGYGAALQRMTGQTTCANCGLDHTRDYNAWLLLTVDHVVPRQEAIRFGISIEFFEDAVNLMLACSRCNGYLNRYRNKGRPKATWTLEEFLPLRDLVFEDRHAQISVRRNAEKRLLDAQPWPESHPNTRVTTPPYPVMMTLCIVKALLYDEES